MDDLDLDAIEKRATRATPGPWNRGGTAFHRGKPNSTSVWGPTPRGRQSGTWVADHLLVPDAEFIAAARTDVPALIARVRELEREAKWDPPGMLMAKWLDAWAIRATGPEREAYRLAADHLRRVCGREVPDVG